MPRLRRWTEMLNALAAAQAAWERDLARAVFASPGRLALLLLLAVPAVVFAAAGETLPDKIPILGGSKAFMPAVTSPGMFCGSILVGLLAGLITGVIGAGGGYILTPALMSFGVRGIMAVGTDQFHLFAKAIFGTAIHRKLGNVNLKLAAWFVVGSVAGVTVGGSVNRAIFLRSPALSDALISTVYVVVLGILAFYAIADWRRLRRTRDGDGSDRPATTDFAQALQRLRLPPFIAFDHNIVPGGRRISIYPVIVCGLIVGFVAAIMGVGGGFLTFPMFVYGLGVSTFTTVGTDILQIIFTTCYSSIAQYAIYGFVFYSIAIGMLLGSLVGVQIGALVTTVVKGSQIRAFYAITILAGFANRVCALPRKLADLGYLSLSRPVSIAVETIGTVVFFAIVGAFAFWIMAVFVRRLPGMRRGHVRHIVRPGKFAAGVIGLLAFFITLAILFAPRSPRGNFLARADMRLNEIAKQSSYYLPDVRKTAAKFAGEAVDLGIRPREFADDSTIIRLLRACGAEAKVAEDGRVRMAGQLGPLLDAALADADLAFANKGDELRAKYGMGPPEVVYAWWVVFDGLTRRYVQDDRGAEAALARLMTSKVLEPAYNFRGTTARSARANALPLAGLLGFYLLYTLWYGFSLMLLFEGLGIGGHWGEKEEA